MRILFLVIACVGGVVLALPEYYPETLNKVVAFDGGVLVEDMNTVAVLSIEQQLKRVLGVDPGKDLNVSAVRDLPDREILRILTLALVGNFTTKQGNAPFQTCGVRVNPETGLMHFEAQEDNSRVTLEVLIVILCAMLIRIWVKGETG
jgi:hypothetical protein